MAQFALNPNVLKNVPLFSSFSDQQLAYLLPAVQHRRFPRGSYVIRAGEETDALYIILAGRAKVLIPDDDGNEVILSVMGPNDFFGEMGLLDVYGRVARLLIEMAKPVEGQWIIEKAPPKQEIARMIGASREMVSRVVKDLNEKGVIRADKRKIYVLDRQSMGRRSAVRQQPSS